MIIDSFCYFNEEEILEARLNTLNKVVDKFVLVEAELTQSLLPKKLFFDENKSKFSKFADKIVHIIVRADECPKNDTNPWNMENYQRNAIKRGLEALNLGGSDIVMISDLDEIPSPASVEFAAKMLKEDYIALAFDMSFHAYFVNLVSPNKGWIGTTATKWETLSYIEPQLLRAQKDSLPRISNAGWHLSWCGGWERVYNKMISCIEPFDKSTVPSPEALKEKYQKRIAEGQFHLLENDDTVSLEKCKIGDFPEYFAANMGRFSHLFV